MNSYSVGFNECDLYEYDHRHVLSVSRNPKDRTTLDFCMIEWLRGKYN